MDPRLIFFAALSALISLAQTLGLAGGEAVFLARVGADALAPAFVLAAVVGVVVTLGYAAVVGRVRNDRLFGFALVGAMLCVTGAAVLLKGASPTAPWVVFCLYFPTQAVLTLHFRTTAVDYFDTQEAKRAFPIFAVASSAGGALGGALAAWSGRPLWLAAAWALGLGAAAAWVALRQGPMRAYRPLDAPELDEPSTEGLRSAVRQLRGGSLASALATAVISMVVAFSLLHYLSSLIFLDFFGDEAKLAAFFGVYLAVSNLLEIAIGALVTPRLLARLGVARAGRVHPLSTLIASLLLLIAPGMPAALLARADRELLENALGGEIRHLAYGAVPIRIRGALRALVEGVLFYASLSLGGLILWTAGENLSFEVGAAIALLASVVYVGAALRVEREYGRTLGAELARGHLDLDAVELGAADVRELRETWLRVALERTGNARVPSALLEIADRLAEMGDLEALRRVARQGGSALRVLCLDRLAEVGGATEALAIDALSADDPAVRAAGARAARSASQGSHPELSRALFARLEDPVPEVRAAAAASLGRRGVEVLEAMVSSGEVRDRLAAIAQVPESLRATLHRRALEGDAAERAAALERLAAFPEPGAEELEVARRGLEDERSEVRCAAVRLRAGIADDARIGALVSRLDDASWSVRRAAATALGALGSEGARAALPLARSSRRWTALAALDACAAAGPEAADPLLADVLRFHVDASLHAAREHAVGEAHDDPLLEQFRRFTLADARRRHQWIAFRVLERCADSRVVRSIESALTASATRRLADAIEALSELTPRVVCRDLALLVSGELPSAEAGARHTAVAGATDPAETSLELERHRMQDLLALQQVPLFQGLGLDQLDAIAKLTRPFAAAPGDVLMREDEAGNELQVLLEGEVRVVRGFGTRDEVELSRMQAVAYFGEIAVLDGAPRSATVQVLRPARLLSLDGERFRELVLQVPEIGLDVIHALTGRLRRAEATRLPGGVASAPEGHRSGS